MKTPCRKEFASHYVEEKRSAYTKCTHQNFFARPVAEEVLSLKVRLNRSICARLCHDVSIEITNNQQYNAEYLCNEDLHATFLWLQTKWTIVALDLDFSPPFSPSHRTSTPKDEDVRWWAFKATNRKVCVRILALQRGMYKFFRGNSGPLILIAYIAGYESHPYKVSSFGGLGGNGWATDSECGCSATSH